MEYGRLDFTICIALMLALVSGCEQPGPGSSANGVSDESPQSQQLPAPDIESIGNATFSGVYDEPVTLVNDRWEGEPYVAEGASRPTAGLANNFYLSGDLDNDGQSEAVVILWEHSGGTGSYSYVAVVGRRDGQLKNIGTARIGDRVQIRDARIDGLAITLMVVQQGPGDAACCPSQKAIRTWSMTPQGLQENDALIDGTMSFADLEEKSWRLIELRRGEPVLQGFPVTLVFDGNRLSGQGSCNRYFAGIEPGDYPGSMAVTQAGATQMACSAERMDFEQQYFRALSGVNRYSFSMRRLALGWEYEGVWNTMLFEAD